MYFWDHGTLKDVPNNSIFNSIFLADPLCMCTFSPTAINRLSDTDDSIDIMFNRIYCLMSYKGRNLEKPSFLPYNDIKVYPLKQLLKTGAVSWLKNARNISEGMFLACSLALDRFDFDVGTIRGTGNWFRFTWREVIWLPWRYGLRQYRICWARR